MDFPFEENQFRVVTKAVSGC